jgi:hypothetical protein
VVWVSSLGQSGSGGIDVYDPAQGTFDAARSRTFCGRAVFAAFTESKVYVPEQGCGDSVDVFAPGGAPLGKIALDPARCLNAHMVLVAAGCASAWLVCEGDHVGSGTLVTLDLSSAAAIGSVELGVFPDGIALVP